MSFGLEELKEKVKEMYGLLKCLIKQRGHIADTGAHNQSFRCYQTLIYTNLALLLHTGIVKTCHFELYNGIH